MTTLVARRPRPLDACPAESRTTLNDRPIVKRMLY